MACIIETGVQLFSRLTSRPNLENLCMEIFKNGGPFPRNIIEISGDLSCGKTTLLLELIARTILPSSFNNLTIGGAEASVIFIDSDHHFDLIRLANIARIKIEKVCKKSNIALNINDIQSIVNESLKRLFIFNIFNLAELECTFYKIGTLINDNLNIALICLDSISSFYWCARDFDNKRLTKDEFRNQILKSLINAIKDYNVIVACTKPSNFVSKYKSGNYFKKPDEFNIDYKIMLLLNNKATISFENIEYTFNYSVNECFEFLNE